LGEAFREAMEKIPHLKDEYSRIYYEGIVFERRAKTHFRRGGHGAGHLAYDWLHRAMHNYERAEKIRQPENDESILRWNSCARILNRHPEICPAEQEETETMLE